MPRLLVLTIAVIGLIAGVVAPARGTELEKPLLLQKPSISRTHVAFCHAGDLWLIGREGGEARRLTGGIGLEFNPLFSPDGSQLAFSGEYDGNLDVYLVPAKGGEPRRLTFHPGVDVAVGWTPDGKSILFSSGRTSYSRFNKLFAIALDGGGFPQELPLPMGEEGTFSPDGGRLAYVPFWNRRAVPNSYIAWKHYRGGKASPIWIADLGDSRIEKIPREDSNDFCPMWIGGKVFFLSDREGSTTLYSYDVATKGVKKELENRGYDLSSASAGPDAIVYEQFGGLHVFDPSSGQSKKLDIRVTADFPAVRPHYDKVAKKISASSISPSGARVAFESRGEILTVPAEKGDIRNLTQTTSAAERDPAWSPDGKTIAYFSDESGEYQLHLRDARGTEEPRRIALGDAPNFYSGPVWSPDNKEIAYADNRLQLWYVNVITGKSTKVDRHAFFSGSAFDAAWSPDSRWLAYTKVLDNRLRAAFLFDTTAGKSHQVTDGMSDVRSLAFDKSGKYLYFTASTDIGPTTNGIDMSGMSRQVTRSVYLVVLNKDLPSPLAPESDEEKVRDPAKDRPGEPGPPGHDKPPVAGDGGQDKEEGKKADDDKPNSDKPRTGKSEEVQPAATKIDLEDIGQRVLALSVPARNYTALQAGKAGMIFLQEIPAAPTTSPTPGGSSRGATVTKFDLEKRKVDRVIEGVTAWELSASGEKMSYKQGDKWFIAAAAGGGAAGAAGRAPGATTGTSAAGSGDGGALKLDDMEVRVDPRAEWRQMFREVWRLQRDFLYDPNFHGYDLAAAEKKYAVFLDGISHRADLNYLFSEMLGNLVLGHMYIGGGDTPEVTRVNGGLLGADFAIDNGRYRFARVYSGENWNPQLRAPLTQPGVNVKEGEYLLAVAGKAIHATDNLYKAFEAKAGKSILIKVGSQADGTDAREVTVVPVESETGLRNLAWVEGNRRKVEQMTDGKVAYVYLPDTGFGGFTNFNRYFFAQVNKSAVVLDERYNGGGKAADYIIDYLQRPLLNYWTARDGKIYTTPGGAIFGPKVMIVNEFAGSGGDAMPWYFRRAKLGPLVGKRTWGGLVGISGYPPLLDGGSVTAPSFAFFSPDGTWDVENHGVAPDVEVEHDPFEVRQGRDPQLEKAVALALEALRSSPPPEPKRPEYPNYHQREAAAR